MDVQTQATLDIGQNPDVIYEVHFAAAILYFLAAIPNIYLVILIARNKKIHSIIIWAIWNLMFSTILRVLSAGTYSAFKVAQFSDGFPSLYSDRLNSKRDCSFLLGFTLFFRTGPVWGLCLIAFVLVLNYGPNKWIRENFTLFRMVEVRIAMWLVDLAHTCFTLSDLFERNLHSTTRCTWQIMVISSSAYELYHWILIHVIVTFGIIGGGLKFYQSQPSVENSEVPITTRQRIKRIGLLIGASLTVATFMLPKFAYVKYSFSFWIGSETICPALMALIMPIVLGIAIPSIHETVVENLKYFRSAFTAQKSDRSGKILQQGHSKHQVSSIEVARSESTAKILPRSDTNESKISEIDSPGHQNRAYENSEESQILGTKEVAGELETKQTVSAEIHSAPMFK